MKSKMKCKLSDIENILIGGLIIFTLAFHDQTKLMVLFQVAGFCFEIVSKKGTILMSNRLKKYVVWEAIFIVFCTLSYFWALNTKTLLNCVVSIFQVTLTGITITLYCDDCVKVKNISHFIILACIILIARLIVIVPVTAWKNGERVGQYLGSGEDGGYGNTGLTYVLSFGALFALYKGINGKRKRYYLLFILLSLFSMLSGSKKAVILFAIVVVLALLLQSKNRCVFLRRAILVCVLVGLAVFLLMNNPILYRAVGIRLEYMINYFRGGETDYSTINRMKYLVQALQIFKENPVAGIGLDGFRYFNKRLCWAENNLMELLADVGIIGTSIYYFFPLYILCDSIKSTVKKQENGALALVLILSLLFVDMTMVTYSNDFLQIYLIWAFNMISHIKKNTIHVNREESYNG